MSQDANRAFSVTVVDEWARAGVVAAAIAPGSRSAPMALALAEDGRIPVDVFLDERSAAFFALGAAKASRRPAVVLCTSGTAAANLHPAVLEAHHAGVPLLVCTADRPPELRDTGAGQSIDQLKLYGPAVRWFCDAGVPDDELPEAPRYWRSVAARAVAAAMGPPAGPVHLNLAFREPLVPAPGTDAVVAAASRGEGAPWVASVSRPPLPHPDDVERLAKLIDGASRGLVVAGWGAEVDPASVERFSAMAGWPVLADPLSGLRCGAHAVSTYEALLRVPGFSDAHRPDLVMQLGAPPSSRMSASWIDPAIPKILVDPAGMWLDPQRSAGERIVADATALLDAVVTELSMPCATPWMEGWQRAETQARAALDRYLDSCESPFEGRVARDVVDSLPAGAALVVGSSMPVRDVEAFARPRRGLQFMANRGVNGIDGSFSTVLGVARVWDGPVVALMGDLTFLHDAGGLLAASRRGVDAVFVVLDNDGGAIFSFLPQAGLPEHFERLFATPHDLDLLALCALHRVPACRVATAGEVVPALQDAIKAGGVRVVVVPSDRTENVIRHRQAWEAVASALV